MKLTNSRPLAVSIVGIFLLAVGCAKPSTPAAAPPTRPGAQNAAATADEPAAENEEETEIQKALAELPDDDRKLAVAQRICPVGLSRLGSMGAPVKVNVEGTDVFICCEGCRKELESESEKYLAELEKIKADPDKYAAEHKGAH